MQHFYFFFQGGGKHICWTRNKHCIGDLDVITQDICEAMKVAAFEVLHFLMVKLRE